jgi:hypothetical protein
MHLAVKKMGLKMAYPDLDNIIGLLFRRDLYKTIEICHSELAEESPLPDWSHLKGDPSLRSG